jgi:phosphoribosyl 1,2-cyclic phosphodiesterase
MLKFVGTGSAFNTKPGNNSSFIRRQHSLLLIDCGGTVFCRLQELNLLDDLDHLHIIITHTHPDHIGSLGDIIFYAFYTLHLKPVILFPERELLTNLLEYLGVTASMYELYSDVELSLDDWALTGAALRFIRVPHVETIPAFGFIFKFEGKCFYYSGDANNIPGEIIEMFRKGELNWLYQDVSGIDYEGNVHLSLRKLVDLIPPELRNRVYCMHHDQSLDKEQVLSYGLNFVERYTV